MYYVKAVPPAKRNVNQWDKSLIDEVAMINWVTWESYISQTSWVTYDFYCTFEVTIIWETIEKRFKENLTTTCVSKESP